jgi:S1-C subfamily serine protease
MKYILYLLFLVPTVLNASNYSDSIQKQQEMLYPTVKVITTTQASFKSGSGFIVNRTGSILTIVTNYHVIKDATEKGVNVVTYPEETLYLATVVYFSEIQDLALLHIETNLKTYSATLCKSKALFGEDIWAVGSGLGLDPYLTYGIISKIPLVMYPEFILGLQHTAQTVAGNSGGPVFIKRNGKYCVIGVNSRALRPHIAWALDVTILKKFLSGDINGTTSLNPPN